MSYEITAYWPDRPEGHTWTVPDQRCLELQREAIEKATREAGTTVRFQVKQVTAAQRMAKIRQTDRKRWGGSGSRAEQDRADLGAHVAATRESLPNPPPVGQVPDRPERAFGERAAIFFVWLSLVIAATGAVIAASAGSDGRASPTAAVLMVCFGLVWPGMFGFAIAFVKAEEKTGIPADNLLKSIAIVALSSSPKHRHHHSLSRSLSGSGSTGWRGGGGLGGYDNSEG